MLNQRMRESVSGSMGGMGAESICARMNGIISAALASVHRSTPPLAAMGRMGASPDPKTA